MSESTSESLDIEKVLQSKIGDRIRFIPRFLINYLKKILHEDDLNEFLKTAGNSVGVPYLEKCIEFLDMKLEIEGLGNLPEEGLCTFVSNHPLGGQDGVALGYILGRHYDGRVKYLVNDLLMNVKGLAPLFIPINKTGAQSKDFPQMVEAGFASDDHIIMFPAGLCSRKQQGVIRDLDWKKTFVTKSVQSHRMVVPIHFGGRNSERFYRIAQICKALHLKINVAMIYLVDEMFRNRHKTFKVTFGKPIPWQTFDKTKTPTQWASYVKDIVYSL